MEMTESLVEHQIPRGGPVYLTDLVGPLTRVPDFETSVVEELQALISEVNVDDSYSTTPIDDNDILVDDLKLFSEEELVETAVKEAIQVENPDPSPPPQQVNTDPSPPPPQQEENKDTSQQQKNTVIPESSRDLVPIDENVKNNLDKSKKKKRGNKRGRKFDRDIRAAQLENTQFLEKIEQVAQIKRRQDEDKIAARLHSFNGGSKVSEASLTLSSDNIAKLTSLRYTTAGGFKVKKSATVEHVRIPDPEVILCVEIYHTKRKWVKTQELLVLGSQMLSELRDQICCSTDQLMQKEGQSDSSGYFLIEDMFCNDTRDPLAIDYSEPIFDWLRNSKEEVREKWECILSGELQQKQRLLLGQAPTPSVPHFKAVEMHKVRFCDLWFRLGVGYLYCHQGDCKHSIVFRDMRLVHPEDVQNRAAYPLVTFQLKRVQPKCSVCNIYRATKVTVDDKWAGENPCYFCDNCYYLLHYDENGSLLYPDFTVYDYHHE